LVLPASLELRAFRTMFCARSVGCCTAVQASRAASHAYCYSCTDVSGGCQNYVPSFTSYINAHSDLSARDKRRQGDVRNRRYVRIPLFWSTVGLVAS
jgi:hypothetical protein